MSNAMAYGDKIIGTDVSDSYITEPYNELSGLYSVGDHCAYNGKYYVCTTTVSTPEPFDSTKWQEEKVAHEIERINNDLSEFIPKLLWTNPNPSATFSPQAITIDGLSNYDYIEVYAFYTKDVHEGYPMPYTKILKGQTGSLIMQSAYNAGIVGARQVTFDHSNNRISIATATHTDGTGEPAYCVPYQIYGGKYQS